MLRSIPVLPSRNPGELNNDYADRLRAWRASLSPGESLSYPDLPKQKPWESDEDFRRCYESAQQRRRVYQAYSRAVNQERDYAVQKAWAAKNPERKLAMVHRYQSKGSTKAKVRARQNERYQEEPHYRLVSTLRARTRMAFKSQALRKSNAFVDLLGCSIPEAEQHIASQFTKGMSWTNHGEWHIDHHIPVCGFDLRCPLQQKLCFGFWNLKPLWDVDNHAKAGQDIRLRPGPHPNSREGRALRKAAREAAAQPAS